MTEDALTETAVVTVFLRHEGDVLLLRRSDAVGSYRGKWGGVAGHVENSPARAARDEIRQETGLSPEEDVSLVSQGEPFAVTDADRGNRWLVHPFLYDVATRDVTTNEETAVHEWVQPPEMRRRETVPDLWRSYDRVRPRLKTIATDREHGSTYLSLRALEVLRDEAAIARADGDRGWVDLCETARTLRSARPTMPVIANRVNRAMADASETGTPAAVERAASAELDRALAADERAAMLAARELPDRVATLSRSETVLAALSRAAPSFVLVAESRPGREGISMAERVNAQTDGTVTITSDAALGETMVSTDVDALVLGADSILPGGTLVNKVGSRAATALASLEGIDCLVVTASDKVYPNEEWAGSVASDGDVRATEDENGDPGFLYRGDSDIEVANPTFGRTPLEWVDAVVTEDGVHDADAVEELANRHGERADWDDTGTETPGESG